MFRQTTIILVILALLASCDNSSVDNITQQNIKDTLLQQVTLFDSIEIIDDIAGWPFLDTTIDSKYFKLKVGERATIKEKLVTNDYDSNIIDTIKIVEWDSSYVETVSNVYTKTEYIRTIRIADSTILFKKDLRVGMPEETVFKIFNQSYNKDKNYKYFLVSYGNGAENYLIFFFENQRVQYISFQPYTG